MLAETFQCRFSNE